ncbi:tyrosine-type recombinase/integrase [Cytobacillus gottheilii]|uniref:Site-specific integrase n=1 Tax=Cytobacillus gottheilii TaxID=859144 RepID=A0ABX8FBN3_9BACI|nr:site-specific integrase [Cytobacillus gottheilii]QVY60977.1 site-specific integrase [Cytobacillus gottheilii]
MHFREVKLKKGKVIEAQSDTLKDPVSGKRRQISARGKSKKEAKANLEKKLKEIEEFGLLTGTTSNTTFAELASSWLDANKNNLKISAHRSQIYHVKRFGKYIANIQVNKISRAMYQNVIKKMQKDGYSRNTIVNAHTCAKKIFLYAIINNIIKESPADFAVIPKKLLTVEEIEANEVEEKYLEHEELKEFLSLVEDRGLINDLEMFYLLSFTGMRIGELCALKESDLNVFIKEISISKTIYNIDGKMHEYELLTPKTEKSIRTISIDPKIVEMLIRHMKRQKERKMAMRDEWHDANFLFTRDNGFPLSPRFVHHRLKRYNKWTTFEKNLHPHIFRHTHTSMLAEAKASLPAIMKRLGHSDGRITTQIYTHVTKKMQSQVDDGLSKIINSIL